MGGRDRPSHTPPQTMSSFCWRASLIRDVTSIRLTEDGWCRTTLGRAELRKKGESDVQESVDACEYTSTHAAWCLCGACTGW